MKIKTIILGSTGMVGEGVLYKSLKHPAVESVLVINRRPCGVLHEKLTEIIHADFMDFSAIAEKLHGYDACFFCMGVSSLGIDAKTYQKITYDLTLHVARTLVRLNPDMTFCYVSGAGTDSSESGRSRWARVKGKTENDLMKLPFRGAYMFRPGYIQPIKGLKNTYKIYKILSPLYPILRRVFTTYVCSLDEIGLAMINASLYGSNVKILENKDIAGLAKREEE
jgi:uncharacterized protein YbjT (DUF2867 family)